MITTNALSDWMFRSGFGCNRSFNKDTYFFVVQAVLRDSFKLSARKPIHHHSFCSLLFPFAILKSDVKFKLNEAKQLFIYGAILAKLKDTHDNGIRNMNGNIAAKKTRA